MIRLHVNIDHIATIRNQRGTRYPEPVIAAGLCELAGAHGITVHLREDRRHILDRDLEILRQTVQTTLNLEMAATAEMLAIAARIQPDIVTLVPEKREEKTTEGGLAIGSAPVKKSLKAAVKKLHDHGIPVSLFIDPEISDVRAAEAIGADQIELHTGDYCNAAAGPPRDKELARLMAAAEEADACGLILAAGHGLDYVNVQGMLHLPGLKELNIGHAIISRAVLVGLDEAVREMLGLLMDVEEA
ncbi:MAG: pyridoxine 5'-phosphate synthase [Deltaproteobacteria bacterium HGW-Deltaproteobacteria-17]|nr:MAG: pyridoxine 5'-phosphate synthase [Deltaproteobacteria bacterium HGW-Deltaproteobacteria-17]